MQNFIAKIEGHGNLNIDWDKGEVKLNIFEGERLFEGILVGRSAEEMVWITPRICGVCPTAHNLASLNTVENALGIKPSKTTTLLRDIMHCGQMIQSHALHLFFLVLPDYVGIDRGTELAQKNPAAFKDALSLKEVSDLMVQVVGGRIVHPTTTTIGGFHKVPTKLALKKLLKKIKETEDAARKTIQVFEEFEYPKLKVDLKLAAQEGDNIVAVSSMDIENRSQSLIVDYKKDIEEEIRDYSTAKFSRYKGEEVLVGSLARLAIGEDVGDKKQIDFSNPFHNNIAQAIEILYYHQKAARIIEELLKMNISAEAVAPDSNPPLKGIGSTEAPRGGLYHEVCLDKDNNITYANIITPTVQNLTSIEKSAKALLEQTKNVPRKEMERLLTMLVRAYDPCISCSAH